MLFCLYLSFELLEIDFFDVMVKVRYLSIRDLFLMCVVYGIVLGMFLDKVQGDGNFYRGLYVLEVEVLRDREIFVDFFEEEFRSVCLVFICL